MNCTGVLYMAKFVLNMAATKLKENPDVEVEYKPDLLVVKRNGNEDSFYAKVVQDEEDTNVINIELGYRSMDVFDSYMKIDVEKSISLYGQEQFAVYLTERIRNYLTKMTT